MYEATWTDRFVYFGIAMTGVFLGTLLAAGFAWACNNFDATAISVFTGGSIAAKAFNDTFGGMLKMLPVIFGITSLGFLAVGIVSFALAGVTKGYHLIMFWLGFLAWLKAERDLSKSRE